MHISPRNIHIRDIALKIFSDRSLSDLEEKIMYSLLENEELNEQERTLIRRIFYGIRHGLLTVVR